MRVARSWITEYVEAPEDPNALAHLLTMSGTKIESVEGEVLEVEVTPNRGDCLSVVGIAREVAAVTGRPLKLPAPELQESGAPTAESLSVEIQASDLCPRYSARLLRNVKCIPSPDWMQQRLLSSGLRPINVIVDVTNYVMLELGQPLHAFDYRRIRGEKIVVRRAGEGEPFVTLDGQERTLDSSILVICDAEGSVAVAGIMGGQNSEVAEDTTTVLLESAHFDAVAVRAGARKLGMNTDSSYRFERGVDPSGTVNAANRAAQLLQELAGAEVAPGVVDAYPKVISSRTIRYRPERGDRLIGRRVPPEEQRRFLESLGLQITKEGEAFSVTVPTFRPDLIQEDDIVEEIARISGYEKIPYRLPGGGFFGKLSPTQAFNRKVREVLLGCSLQEVLTHSLVDPALLHRFCPLPPIRVRNPLSEEFAALRTSLAPMLVGVAERNARHGFKDINIFEVGQVFLPKESGEGADEPQRAAGLLCGSPMAGRWNLGKAVPLEADFFAAKGVVEALLNSLHIEHARFEAMTAPGMHPGRTANVFLGDALAGGVGQIHPKVQEELELPGPTYVFELDLEVLRKHEGKAAMHPLPRFPGVSRDLAMLVPVEVEAGTVRQVLVDAAGPALEDATLFDVYQGQGVPEGRKSLAFALRFRSPERTLTDAEVDEAVKAIRAALAEQVSAQER
jgi:phenylalanyl-tRNA synthetase beta chain